MAKPYQIGLWKRAPFIRLLPPLICGIITGYFFDVGFIFLLTSFAILSFLIVMYEVLNLKQKFIFRQVSGMMYMILIFLFGMLVLTLNNIKEHKNWYGHHLQEAIAFKIIVKSKSQKRSRYIKTTAEIVSVVTKDSVFISKGKAIFYFQADSLLTEPSQGDVFIVKNSLQKIRNTGNPGSFDYEAYMANKRIFHQAFLKSIDWEFTGENHQNFFDKAIHHALMYSQNAFHSNMNGPQEIALSKALLTGDRTELDRDLVQAYANTGVVHIMAISGLHLGLIYLFLIRLARILPLINRNDFLMMLLVLGGIWFFALMTGGSPSVMRAAVMFSFLSFGIVLKKKVATYNFWSASAFLLLCFNPYLLFNVGFQLSYLAVLGILVVQKPIYHWFYFENKIVDYTWQIISVTLSAQVFTLPLSLFYFHQFPLLFALTNLIAIPLASLGLWLGVLLLLTAWIPLAGQLFGSMAEFIFGLLNAFIHYMNSFSFSVWSGFFPGITETIVLSFLIIAMIYWLLLKKRTALKFMLLFMITLGGLAATDSKNKSLQQKVIVYNISSCTAIDFISGNSFSHISNIPEEQLPSAQIILNAARQLFKVKEAGPPMLMVKYGENDLYLSANNFFHIKQTSTFSPLENRIKVDAIILSNSPKVSIAELARTFKTDLYIFPPSNKRYQIEKWKKECEELHLRSHDIMTEGALVLNY